ncbi:ankyrin repeat domain-containing protein [Candidatus Riflebacteria bacterium]
MAYSPDKNNNENRSGEILCRACNNGFVPGFYEIVRIAPFYNEAYCSHCGYKLFLTKKYRGTGEVERRWSNTGEFLSFLLLRGFLPLLFVLFFWQIGVFSFFENSFIASLDKEIYQINETLVFRILINLLLFPLFYKLGSQLSCYIHALFINWGDFSASLKEDDRPGRFAKRSSTFAILFFFFIFSFYDFAVVTSCLFVSFYNKPEFEFPLSHWAVRYENKQALEIILESGWDLDEKDKTGSTPLHLAIQFNNYDLAGLLISKKADVNVKNLAGETPMHEAVKQRNAAIIKILLQNDADINAQDSVGLTPLHLAVNSEDKDITALLLANHADSELEDANRCSPIELARQKKLKEIIPLLEKNKSKN